MKKLLIGLAILSSVVAHAAGVVNVYTTRHYDADDALYKEFSKKTGIEVNVVSDKGAVSITKIKEQGRAPLADVFMTSDAGNLAKAKEAGILQPVESSILESNIPSKYQDDDNQWFGLTKRARVFIYSNDRVKAKDLKGLTYESLVKDSRWDDKVLVRSSSNMYNQSLVASFVALNGQKKTSEWVGGLVDRMARNPKGNDRVQAVAVKDGEGDIAIANSYYYGKLVNETDASSKYYGVADKTSLYFPNQNKGESGVHMNISGAGVVKNARNKKEAIKLIEFLSMKKQQEAFSATNYEFPVNPEANMSPLLASWLDKQGIKTLKEQNINLSLLGKYNEEALNIMIGANWDTPKK
ncbi:extracellular solute-binding protein [uncultured Ilyobacter sp.]|uniref:extracellular solute-binding protein n=1 Tax=uncultured Ilyobacter sp. TaxID=544433 RepID=UPI0029C8B293|nr:extracellular solute-binding protein [uncultured Ilyobacter sp.]